MELINYIDFASICDDFNLETGDITPMQQVELENIIKQFIKQNKQFTDKIRYTLDNIYVTNVLIMVMRYREMMDYNLTIF